MTRPRVAILGAGVAGLSCAHELERLGCRPVIYEISRCVGHSFPHAGAVLEILFRSITTDDICSFMGRKYGINLDLPVKVKKITQISANNRSTVSGDLGYMVVRGQLEDSFENKISHLLKNTVILFDRAVDWRELAREYDYLVVATATKQVPAAFGLWQDIVKMSIMGAVVLGDFAENELFMWLNDSYTNKGYAYLAPFNSRRAALVLAAADIRNEQLPFYWNKFIAVEKINLTVVEQFTTFLTLGLVHRHRVNNIFFAGVSGGFIDPLLGMGAVPSMLSGVLAARSIVYGLDYEKEVAFLVGLIKKVTTLRKTLAKLDNTGIDRLIGFLGLPGVQHVVYRTKIDFVSKMWSLLRLARQVKP